MSSSKLNAIREQIDKLDDRIHDLLMERADLIKDVGAEKRRIGAQIVMPAREAMMIRRLLARHGGDLPQGSIVRIWRELVGAVSMLQTGLKVAVCADARHAGLSDMARDYFGGALPTQKANTPAAAISLLRDGQVDFAVVPWPEDGERDSREREGAGAAWWRCLMDEMDPPLRIVTRLPYGHYGEAPPHTDGTGLVLSRIAYQSSGEDDSFLFCALEPHISRGRLVDAAKGAGFEALNLYTIPARDEFMPSFHLLHVRGYIDSDAEGDRVCLDKILEILKSADGRIFCVGGYPVPPVFPGKGPADHAPAYAAPEISRGRADGGKKKKDKPAAEDGA